MNRRLRAAVCGILLTLTCAGSPRALAQTGTVLQLSVTVNGQPTGLIGEFVQRNGTLLVRPEEWEALGLRAITPPGADGLMALESNGRLRWTLDAATQTLILTAPPDLLVAQRLEPGARRPGSPTVESGTGLTANYDLTARTSAGQLTAGGFLDLRAFSPIGVASTGLLVQATPAQSGTSSLLRLDSTLSYADPDSLRRYRIGDTINGSLKWSRPVRMAGLQLQSDFSLRPDLITFAVPSVGGTASVPSTVDVLVNNTPAISGAIRPGPFEVSQLPIVTGAGTITTNITNALGQQVTTTLPFYASTDILAQGLESYSLEAGFVRDNWGLASNDYRKLAVSFTYQRGLLPFLTGEVHAESSGGLAMGGAGFTANLFNLGTVDLALAGSTMKGHDGGRISFGANRLGSTFSFGVSAILSLGDFRDIAWLHGAPAPRRLVNANAGLNLGQFGAIGVSYTSVTRDATRTLVTPGGNPAAGGFTSDDRNSVAPGLSSLVPAQKAELAAANYSVQLGRFSVHLTGFHDFAGNGGGGVLSLTVPLGPRSSASASMGAGNNGSYRQLQATQAAVTPGDWGYQFYAADRPDHQFLDVQYKSGWGTVWGGFDHLEGRTSWRAQAQGSLTWLQDAGLFASNPIHDSFAVVHTGEATGVAVMAENRLVGRTGSDGFLLVPDLRAFEPNNISIDPNDVPVTSSVGVAARDVRPQDRSGVIVPFPITRSNAALIKLTDAAGTPLPVGSAAILAGSGTSLPMGHDGALYVETLRPSGNLLTVTRPDGRRCSVRFDYAAAPDTIPTIGPLVCREQ